MNEQEEAILREVREITKNLLRKIDSGKDLNEDEIEKMFWWGGYEERDEPGRFCTIVTRYCKLDGRYFRVVGRIGNTEDMENWFEEQPVEVNPPVKKTKVVEYYEWTEKEAK